MNEDQAKSIENWIKKYENLEKELVEARLVQASVGMSGGDKDVNDMQVTKLKIQLQQMEK